MLVVVWRVVWVRRVLKEGLRNLHTPAMNYTLSHKKPPFRGLPLLMEGIRQENRNESVCPTLARKKQVHVM